MATPEKTLETLNLAEEMNSNESASGSTDCVIPKDDALNANFSESMTNRLNDVDMAFIQTVVTKHSSSDFISHDDETNYIREPPSGKFEIQSEDEHSQITEDEDSLTSIKPDNDQKWKPQVGKVYNRVLEIQKSKPKKYTPTSFTKQETVVEEILEEAVEVKPEVVSCPKCKRKVASGAINRHMQFCFPSDASSQDQTQ